MDRSYFLIIVFISCFYLPVCTQTDPMTFNKKYDQILDKYMSENRLDYEGMNLKSIEEVYQLSADILHNKELKDLSIHTAVNLYNFLVIYQVRKAYPCKSVMDIPNFFTNDMGISETIKSLDDLEHQILSASGNPMIHVLLNCGAVSCPPIQFLEEEIPLESYINNAFKEEEVLKYSSEKNTLFLSRIFFWYKDEFNYRGNIQEWISDYFMEELSGNYTIDYQEYNWQLNDLSSDEYLYIYPTKLYRKGGFELKVFNNYYTQDDSGLRTNFFSSFIQFLIGTNKNYNIGFDIKLRSVNQGNVALFSALNFKNQPYYNDNGTLSFSRFGVAGIGPRIKYQPFKDKGNINILHAIYYVPMDGTEGNLNYGYFDFQNLQIFNNLWYEKEYSVRKRLFVDIGFHIENIKLGVQRNENHFMQIVLPLTGIYSYYPNQKTTFYFLGNYAQKFQFQFDYDKDTDFSLGAFAQIGTGMKFYLTDFLELEGLYTYFIDSTPGRTAHTFNIGIRLFK